MNGETGGLKTILLVEDDRQDVELMLAALAEHNLANSVTVVANGADALDYLFRRGKFESRTSDDPIVVLLDNKMPKIDGLEVLKIIKADKHLKMIPVVALTSSRETPDLVAFYKHGVNAYVVKPVDFSDFMTAIKHLGLFWVAINEPPPFIARLETVTRGVEIIPPGKKEAKDEMSTPHPAFGG